MKWPEFVRKALASQTLSGEEKRVLLAVAALIDPNLEGELTQGEIGEVVGMTQPSVSTTLSSLVKNGFLTKRDAPRGRHKVYGFGVKMRALVA